VTLLLENTAGQGNSIRSHDGTATELLDAAGNPPDVEVCLDSAPPVRVRLRHRVGGGWDALLAEMKEKKILPLVRMWHLNDSKTVMGSRVDRHEHIGGANRPPPIAGS
jgi:deoxyribonuclease-4